MKKIFIYAAFLLVAISCNTKHDQSTAQEHTEAKEKYTCPMHPSVMQDSPGQCSICGMDLVPVTKASTNDSNLMLTDTQVNLANVTTQIVKAQNVEQTLPINAQLKANEDLTEVISARSTGRIEKLYIKETGRTVKQGEPLYELYSETLLTLQKEYLLAKEQFEKLGDQEVRYASFLNASEKKLLLYGLSRSHIDKLRNIDDLSARILFLSPASGIIKEINVAEGQTVAEGSLLYQIENTKQLWVEAELYPREMRLLKIGDKIKVQLSGFETEATEATIIFLSPELRANKQVAILRGVVSNPSLQWKPGQSVQVFLQHSARKALSIPVDAVIRDEHGSHVYVQTDKNTFAARKVKTGIENFNSVEITEGLIEGEVIAVTGAYLLYSEVILKKGIDPSVHAGHEMQ